MNSNAVRRVAITGASGLIGRRLCDFFLHQGWQVRALVRQLERYPAAADGPGFYHCDLPQTIDPAGLEGADVLIHAAYATRGENAVDARRVNEEGSERLFELAQRQGVGTVLFVSSFSARADARSYYGRSKFAVEQMLRPGRDLSLRAGLVLAAEGGLFRRIVGILERSRFTPLVGGNQHVQTLHVDDLCVSCQQAVVRNITGVLHVAEPAGQTFAELLGLVLLHLRRRCLLIPVPSGPVWAALRLAEALRIPLAVTSENVLGIRSLEAVRVDADLSLLGITARAATESVPELISVSTTGNE